jgi:hypothetical protein
MPPPKLYEAVSKDQVNQWIENALRRELFPYEKSSLANAELHASVTVRSSLTIRSMTDETHVFPLETEDAEVFRSVTTQRLRSRPTVARSLQRRRWGGLPHCSTTGFDSLRPVRTRIEGAATLTQSGTARRAVAIQ